MNIRELDYRGRHDTGPAMGGGAMRANAAQRRVGSEEAPRGSGPRIRSLMAVAFAMGGAVRDAVYVTADALRGRYDHF